METIRKITEDDMVAAFLKAEIDSPRFGDGVKTALKNAGAGQNIVMSPNTDDSEENKLRATVLGECRGYPDKQIFSGFPVDVSWEFASLEKSDLEKILYIDDDYWVKLSNGTRLPTEAAKNINNGVEIYEQSNQRFIDTAEKIRNGIELPEMIIVGDRKGGKLVVIEGHLRLTSYAMALDAVPDNLKAIVGYSENMGNWELF